MEQNTEQQTPDIENVLKTFISRVSNVMDVSSGSNVPSTSKGVNSNSKDIPIHQQIPDISQEFAGIVFALNQIISSGVLTQRQGVNLMRQFYEYDTGQTLRVSFLENIVMHEKVKNYETKIMPNIMKRFKKDESLKKIQETEECDLSGAPKENSQVSPKDSPQDLDNVKE